ncbi:PAS domain-containing protein [Siccirubricoccus deserti]
MVHPGGSDDRRHAPEGLLYPWAVELFAAFILLCGATHFMAAWTLWHPGYGVQGMLKAATAVVSVVTAIVIWPLLPRILALPSVQALAEANASLRREIGERREAEHRARYSEARLAGFFEHIPDALFVVRAEPEGCILETVNPSFCRLFRAPRKRWKGSARSGCWSPRRRPSWQGIRRLPRHRRAARLGKHDAGA